MGEPAEVLWNLIPDDPPEDYFDECAFDDEQLPVEQPDVVALGTPKGPWYAVRLDELPLYRPLPGDAVQVVDHEGHRGVARVQCTNWINKTAHLVPIWWEKAP